MKTYAVLSLLLLTSWGASGQGPAAPESETEAQPRIPAPTKELLQIARSDTIKTFADAFLDPNVVIGVFEYPREITTTGLPTDAVLAFLDKYWTAQEQFGVRMLRCVKMIKGNAPIPAIFVYDRLAPDLPQGLQIPSFIPVAGSRWILALEKTTRRSRLARFGPEISTYNFLEDRTLFRMYHYGHGSLCLSWPQDQPGGREARRARTVPETTVDDFAAILRVVPVVYKDPLTLDDAGAVGLTWRSLKTPTGKAVLRELLGDTPTN